MYKLETIAFTIESCITGQESGAHRIELCGGPGEGGTTPSFGFIKKARKLLSIDLFVMIRPRGGDFLYSNDEFEIMKEDVRICRELGCHGIVTGILTADGQVDIPRNRELLEIAGPMKATFHRAFDRAANLSQALEDVIGLGFERVLTSGGFPDAMQGADTLAQLVKQADGRIIIMPGAGVTAANISLLAARTGAKEFHSSASSVLPSTMDYTNAAMQEQLQTVIADPAKIKEMVKTIRQLSSS